MFVGGSSKYSMPSAYGREARRLLTQEERRPRSEPGVDWPAQMAAQVHSPSPDQKPKKKKKSAIVDAPENGAPTQAKEISDWITGASGGGQTKTPASPPPYLGPGRVFIRRLPAAASRDLFM